MKKTAIGNYAKLIAFFIVAVLLVLGFGFTTEGLWNNEDSSDTPATSNQQQNNIIQSEKPSEPKDETPSVKLPDYYNFLTGLESSEESSRKRHFAFVLDATAPLYGASWCDVIAELPTEENGTRFLAFTNTPEKLSKIGSITSTRAYISNVARFLSSVIIAHGNDGDIEYESCQISGSFFDLKAHSGYYYTEYSQFKYTNGDLINAGIYNANVNTTAEPNGSLPFNFVEYGKKINHSTQSAKSIILPFSDKSETELYYSATENAYTFNKNGTLKTDTLTDKKISFTNVFILFADTITYEASSSTEMVMNTIGEGSGFYATDGYCQSITWESDSSGNMIFFDTLGNKLTVNRGNAYIGFVKSIKAESVQIS